MKIAISGLTAAGKTTLAKRLAGSFELSYLSGSQILRSLLGDQAAEWTPQLDLRRTDLSVERRVDDEVLAAYRARSSGVFDAWSLPWLAEPGHINVWIESDLPSRARKCVVSYVDRGRPMSYTHAEELVTAKDDTSRRIFKTIWGFDLFTDRSPFHIVLEASSLIPEMTVGAAHTGSDALFHAAVCALDRIGVAVPNAVHSAQPGPAANVDQLIRAAHRRTSHAEYRPVNRSAARPPE